MTTEEFKKLIPNSKFTPQSITDIAKVLTGVNYDLQKFRLVGFNYTRLSGSLIVAPANQIFLILKATGDGTILLNGHEGCPLRYVLLEDYVCYQFEEPTSLVSQGVEWAIFSWD